MRSVADPPGVDDLTEALLQSSVVAKAFSNLSADVLLRYALSYRFSEAKACPVELCPALR